MMASMEDAHFPVMEKCTSFSMDKIYQKHIIAAGNYEVIQKVVL